MISNRNRASKLLRGAACWLAPEQHIYDVRCAIRILEALEVLVEIGKEEDTDAR